MFYRSPWSQPWQTGSTRSVAAAKFVVRESSMRLCKFFFVGCLSLLSLASHAETLNGLYQVLEPVSSQSPQERDQATDRKSVV